jgi:3-hydroxy-9,10-secoandrosta-1,3,5(10)-triene-9,17-dione monooxygenase
VILERAAALRSNLLERQEETEELSYYPASTHADFLDAGFYRMLVPRRFGGLELDLPTFWRVIISIARGCPSSAWSLCLATGHALQVASFFEERAQDEFFGDGDLFLCAAVAAPAGVAVPAAGGWTLSGTHPYSSGAPYATHFMGQTFVADGAGGGPSDVPLLFVAPRSAWTMLDDWGDSLGLRGSGSHSLQFEEAWIPGHYALPGVWMTDVDVSQGTPGYRLHANPMYAGRTMGFFQGELAAVMIGAAKGALDEYELIIRTRSTQRPPIVPRYQDSDYQRWFGTALGRIATAEAALLQVGDQFLDLARRGVEDDFPFSRGDDLRLNVIGREAMGLAWEAMQQHLYRTAGSSAARRGQRLERIFRDMAMGWGHFMSIRADWAARELAREHLGVFADDLEAPV